MRFLAAAMLGIKLHSIFKSKHERKGASMYLLNFKATASGPLHKINLVSH